jgi:hypothetical protein
MLVTSVNRQFLPQNGYFAKSDYFILYKNNGLAVINVATMPLQITEKPSFDTTASTKALMVQNQYQE